jgi:RHS repeat-associated protein
LKQGIDVDANGVLSLTSSDVFADYSAGIPASGIQQITENGVTAWWEVKSQLSPVTQNVTPAVTAISSQRKQLGTAVPLMVSIAPDGTRTEEETVLELMSPGTYTLIKTVKRPGAASGEVSSRGYLHGGVIDENLPGLSSAISYGYTNGQVSSVSDPRRSTQFFEYHPTTGQLEKMKEWGGYDDTGILPDRQTLYSYYPATHANAGKLKEVVHPDGKKETYVYDLLGRVTAINPLTFNASGAVLNRDEMAGYPVSYTYNAHGQKETMTVWRNEAGASTPEVTTWNYWFGGGPLAQKLWSLDENSPLGEMYYYYSANQLASHFRGEGTTQYTYDGAGRLTGKSYSDGTPSVSITYDRIGRQTSVTDGSGTRTLAYNGLSLVWSSIDYGGGPLHGTGLRHTFDAQGRPLTLGVTRKKTSTTWDPRTLATYSYLTDTTQLASVKFGSHTAHYQAYDSQVNGQVDTFETLGTLPAEILYKVAQSTSVTRTSLRGTRLPTNADGSNLNQPLAKQLVWQRGTTSSGGVEQFTDALKHDYRHDTRGRRTSDVQLDGTVWAHEYNSRGEVIGAARSDSLAGNPGPGRRFGYAYDDIGNRTAAVENTFDNGNPNLPAIDYDKTTYTTNKSNAYEVLMHSDPSKYWVLGRTSTGTGTLLVKHTKTGTTTPVVTAPLDRYGVSDKDFAAEISSSVTNAPAYRNVKVTVGTTTTTWGDLYMPPKNEALYYSWEHGNLTGDSRWLYDWDAENRLISMETTSTAVAAGVPKQRLEFTYDSESRRVRKVRKGWVSNAWVVQADLRFLYDGWNLVAELEPVVVTSATSLPAYVRTYTWGKDVTGTEQGAGGVGGLLFVGRYTKDTGTNVLASTLAPMYDGNSNIEGYVKLLVPTASTSAAATTAFKLEYDPFGRELMIEATSPETQATLPPFRFSTKYTDSETDLVYYGYRYYSPELGRWPSRDPIGERGGINLYGMVGNDAVNRWDYLGLAPSEPCSIELHVGHWSTVKSIWKERKKEGWKPPCGYAFGTMSCFSVETMGQLENEIGEDNLLKNTGLTVDGLDFFDKVSEKLADFVAKARERAQKICDSECCKGKQVTIKVRCDPDLVEWANKNNANGLKAFCGKDLKHDCPKK